MARRTAMAAVALAAMAASPIPEVKAAAAETSPAASGPPPEASISSATELEATSTPDVEGLRAEIEALTRQLGVDQQRNTELSEMLEAQAKDHCAEIEHLRIELLAHRNDAWAKREAELEAEVKGYRVEVERLRAEALAQRDDFNDAWAKREAEIKARFDVMRESAAPLIALEQLPVLPEEPSARRHRARGKLALVINGQRVVIPHGEEIPVGFDVSTLPTGSYEVIR